jgi:TnsA endonuclease N terminal
MKKYAQGVFQLTNPQKYVGRRQPLYRSSWEHAVMRLCDNHPGILQWANEALHINYQNPFTGKNTIYVPDFFVMFQDANGKQHGEIWEVKPQKETSLMEAGRSPRAQAAAVLNAAKWQACRQFCSAHGLQFRVITENQLWNTGPARKR